MFPGIEGRRVLITGGSGGIGSEIARKFGLAGAVVGVHYNRNEAGAVKVVNELMEKGVKADLFHADLTNGCQGEELVKKFAKTFGSIDILVNNAGTIIGAKNFLKLDEESWEQTISLVLKAPFFISRRAFLFMKESGGGRIINISSIGVKFGGSRNSIHYSAGKAGLESMTRSFAREGAPHNILVNAIRPGVIDTAIHSKSLRTKDQMEQRIGMIPLHKMGKPEDIANMALYLASSYADFITGQIFTVSGGE